MEAAMKSVVLLSGILVFAALAGAQITESPQRIDATAASITQIGNSVQLRSNVQIRRDGLVITADEADITTADGQAPLGIELRGNVRVTAADGVQIPIVAKKR
jgi:lipopolysaccharide export system protein LptA